MVTELSWYLGSTENGGSVRLAVVTDHSTTRLMHSYKLHWHTTDQLHVTSKSMV